MLTTSDQDFHNLAKSPGGEKAKAVASLIFVVCAGVLWGTSGIFVNLLSPYGFTPMQMSFSRGSVSLICILVFALIKCRGCLKVKPREIIIFFLMGTSLFFTASCYYTAIEMTSVSTAVTLMYTAPIYVTVFSAFFFGEKLSAVKIISIVVMVLGCCLVSGIVGGGKFDPLGVLIGIFSGIAYAGYSLLTKAAMRRGSHPIATNLYTFLFMSAIAFCFSSPQSYGHNVAKAPEVTLPLLVSLGVFTFVMPYLLYTISLKTLSAGTASALSIVEPMSATVFSILLFSEPLRPLSAIGMAMILISVFLLGKCEGGDAIKKQTINNKKGTKL